MLLSFLCAVLETASSNTSTCFEFCLGIFHNGLLLLLLDILLTAPPSLVQIDYNRNNPQKSLIQYNTVKHITISFDSQMSFLRHTQCRINNSSKCSNCYGPRFWGPCGRL